MDDQYWIKKYLAPTASHGCRWHADLPAACRGPCMSSSGRPQHGRGASLDHEVALPKQCRPTASYSWSGPGKCVRRVRSASGGMHFRTRRSEAAG